MFKDLSIAHVNNYIPNRLISSCIIVKILAETLKLSNPTLVRFVGFVSKRIVFFYRSSRDGKWPWHYSRSVLVWSRSAVIGPRQPFKFNRIFNFGVRCRASGWVGCLALEGKPELRKDEKKGNEVFGGASSAFFTPIAVILSFLGGACQARWNEEYHLESNFRNVFFSNKRLTWCAADCALQDLCQPPTRTSLKGWHHALRVVYDGCRSAQNVKALRCV